MEAGEYTKGRPSGENGKNNTNSFVRSTRGAVGIVLGEGINVQCTVARSTRSVGPVFEVVGRSGRDVLQLRRAGTAGEIAKADAEGAQSAVTLEEEKGLEVDQATGASVELNDGWVFDNPEAYNEGYASKYRTSYGGRVGERVSPLVALDYVLKSIPNEQAEGLKRELLVAVGRREGGADSGESDGLLFAQKPLTFDPITGSITVSSTPQPQSNPQSNPSGGGVEGVKEEEEQVSRSPGLSLELKLIFSIFYATGVLLLLLCHMEWCIRSPWCSLSIL